MSPDRVPIILLIYLLVYLIIFAYLFISSLSLIYNNVSAREELFMQRADESIAIGTFLSNSNVFIRLSY
jgi:hypothetical protein